MSRGKYETLQIFAFFRVRAEFFRIRAKILDSGPAMRYDMVKNKKD